jgi:rhodanese-related sulfurtransferase
MKKFIYLLFLLVFAFPVFTAIADDTPAVIDRLEMYNVTLPQGYGIISTDVLSTMLVEEPAVLLLDVRQPEEYAAGHLEGSFNVPIRTLAQNLDLLPDLHANIVVICKSGGRATLAATSLGILGYDNVKILKGGFGAWDAAEMPTTTDVYTAEIGTAPEFDATVYEAIDTYLTTLPEGYGFVSPQNLAVEMSDNPPLVIDVRGLDEWNAGYIDGSQHIWINEFMSRQDEWPADKDTPIVITCASGYRGSIATVMMRLAGYTNVRNLGGGTNGWTAAGFPLVGVDTAEFDLNAYLTDYVAGLPGNFNAVRVDDLVTELSTSPDLLLVDVRTADEYAEGFIEGAVNIPLHELTQQLNLLPDLNQNIVVYCGSGHRSALAMTALNLLGYENTRSLIGGFGLWASSGNPTSLDVPPVVAGTVPEIDSNVYDAVDNFLTAIPAGYYTVKDVDLKVELGENPPVLFDVRTDNEWQQGYIEGSLHLPLSDFMTLQSEWPQDMHTAVVIYDNPTHRSTMAMMLMRLLGYDNVRVLAGGTAKWTNDMLPLVTD